MIHVLTVHWRSDRWIDVQLAYLKQHIREPFRVYAYLNHVPDGHQSKFYYASTDPIESHAIKLNRLAKLACSEATSDHDLLLFIDGDAVPIGDVCEFTRTKLEKYPLLAVQRLENGGDDQPHPCFCICTVGLWKTLPGDWESGAWRNSKGTKVMDVGGRMVGLLHDKQVVWHPILRSNKVDLHPLWFGIYGNVVYHHGAGFRGVQSRIDFRNSAKWWEWMLIRSLWENPDGGFMRGFRDRIKSRVRGRFLDKNTAMSEEVFEKILRDPQFYRMFAAGA